MVTAEAHSSYWPSTNAMLLCIAIGASRTLQEKWLREIDDAVETRGLVAKE